MSLTREEVLHIAKLARVGLGEQDIAMFQEQLSEILEHFKALRRVDTEDVPPTSHPLALESVMRDDEVGASFPRDEILANAPRTEADAFRVRAILE